MRRIVFALLLAASAAACTAAGGSSSASVRLTSYPPPPRPLASSCGPTVVIENVGQSPVAVLINGAFAWVYINGEPKQTIPAGATAQLNNYDGMPPLPLELEVTRSNDGVVLLTAHLIDDSGPRFVVGDVPVAMASPVSTGHGCSCSGTSDTC